jgi:S1-C subfamily serine protease
VGQTPSLSSLAALVAAGALGGVAAVGAVTYLGGFEGDTVTVEKTVAAPGVSSVTSGATLSVNQIYERSAPGVVQITSTMTGTTQTDQPGSPSDTPAQRALGSGFVIDKSGHIVTNYHVVEGADDIKVSFSNRDTVEATVVGQDPSTDLAVLRVETTSSALRPLPLGNSDQVKVGDQVIAIGNPFGLSRTATAGIVSALQRPITAPNGFTIDHVIQTDAPINHGNSGGPLLNARGEVIGVNSQIETGGTTDGNVGIGFAVPANTVKDVVAQILRSGRVDRAYLGIRAQEVSPDLAQTFRLPIDAGLLVQSVADGSGAAKAGLRGGDTQVVVEGESYALGGDIIVAVDGKRVATIDELRDAIAAHKPGDELRLEVYRDDAKKSVTVTLGRQPATAG